MWLLHIQFEWIGLFLMAIAKDSFGYSPWHFEFFLPPAKAGGNSIGLFHKIEMGFIKWIPN
jgi:hypothetical protein